MKNILDVVPKWSRIVVGILAVLNIAYGITGYFTISLLFKDASGIDYANTAIKHASYEFAARNLAIGLALGIVSMRGIPESIAIVTIIRALIEIQTIIIAVVNGNISAILLMPAGFLAVELFIIKTMVGAVDKRNARQ